MSDFEKAAKSVSGNFVGELWYFALAALMLMSSTAAAPFINTLF